MLSAGAEQALCHDRCDHHDVSAAHQMVGSHLRLVARVAKVCRGYGLPPEDLIGEGHIGMMRALCRFEPDRAVRFASCALRWVRPSIEEYILHNWSRVKIGTTASQKKLLTANFASFSSSGRRGKDPNLCRSGKHGNPPPFCIWEWE
jgi:RNA polymerase sigma-32 factor